ncbi:MAG: hypothetical protein IMZ69_01080 [Spirochaetes bacterium]|nr:hypothetical protein [Spirochaetota bacterium]
MRKLTILLLALLVLFTAGSCKLFDMLFYKAPGVSAKDLASYSGTLPTTRDKTLMTIGYGGMVTMGAAGTHVINSSEVQGAFPSQVGSVFNAIPTFRLLAPFISKVKAKFITLTQTGMTDSSTNKEFHLDIENESVTSATQTGTLTIDKCKADLSATVTGNTVPWSGEGDAEVDCLITASNLKDTSFGTASQYITVNGAQVGVKAKATMSFDVDATSTGGPTSLTYDITSDVKAGFSISDSNPDTINPHYSGKFIIEMNYIDSGTLTKTQMDDPTDISNIEVTIKIKVYNNDNDLVDEYELNQDDLATYITAL